MKNKLERIVPVSIRRNRGFFEKEKRGKGCRREKGMSKWNVPTVTAIWTKLQRKTSNDFQSWLGSKTLARPHTNCCMNFGASPIYSGSVRCLYHAPKHTFIQFCCKPTCTGEVKGQHIFCTFYCFQTVFQSNSKYYRKEQEICIATVAPSILPPIIIQEMNWH